MTEEDEEYLYIPTITQQKIVSVLSTVSSIFSIIGSWSIMYNVIQNKTKTPYRRLLLGLSTFDFISTLGWMSQPYLMTSDVINSYVWSFGNDTSCKALATILQIGIGAILYSSCLSFYFVLTIRFGMREATFAKRIEKAMHFLVITFSLGTSVTGLVTDMYYPMHVGPGCWVSHPPEGDICANDSCGAAKMAWVFAGLPGLFSFASITINNLLLYCHVRSTVIRGQAKAMEMEKKLLNDKRNQAIRPEEDEDPNIQNTSTGLGSSGRSSGQGSSSFSWMSVKKQKSVLRSSDMQWKRVKAVGRQSFLYVGSYFLCFIWLQVKQALDGQGLDKIEGSGSIFLPLLILVSVFSPIQGFLNSLIFFRPKYFQARTTYGRETRWWCVKRAIFGEKIGITIPGVALTPSQHSTANNQISFAGELESERHGASDSHATRISKIESIAESQNERT